MPRKTVTFTDRSTGEYDESGFQLLYKGTIFVNSPLDEPMNFAPNAKAERTESGIRIGNVQLVPAKTISFNITNKTPSIATYIEGALEVHHGTDVYMCEEDPLLGLSTSESRGSIDDGVLTIQTPAGRHVRICTLSLRE